MTRKHLLKPLVLALFLFFLSLLPRLILLDKIPIGIPHDNMIFALNSEAVFHTGRDVTGLWHPLSFAPIPDEPAQAEITYALLAPTVGTIDDPLIGAHILHAFVNALLVVVVFFIVLKLLNKKAAFIAGLVVCFNPWSIFFARSAYEASLVQFFYLAGFLILLYTKSWKKLWAVLLLALGFYTYMAYKVTLLPYAALISLFTWSQIDHKKYTKQYLVLLSICIFIFLSFLINLRSQTTADRVNEATFVSPQKVAEQVDSERKQALENPLDRVFSNKATISAKIIVTKYLGAFSPELLFLSSEATQRFHLYNHGYFYYADFVFFLLGICYLFLNKRKLLLFFLGILIISPLPSVVSNVETSYAMRASLYIPFICIIVALGIWWTLILIKNKRHRAIVTAVILFAYSLLVANFLYSYFFIQPVATAEGSAFSARLVSSYVDRANKSNQKVVIVAQTPKNLFKNFIYFSNLYDKSTASEFKKSFVDKNYSFSSVKFMECDDVSNLDKKIVYIFDPSEDCDIFKKVKPTLSIPQISDTGTVYKIYQDSICTKYDLRPFVGKLRFSDLDIEDLSGKSFCETYIIDYERQ